MPNRGSAGIIRAGDFEALAGDFEAPRADSAGMEGADVVPLSRKTAWKEDVRERPGPLVSASMSSALAPAVRSGAAGGSVERGLT